MAALPTPHAEILAAAAVSMGAKTGTIVLETVLGYSAMAGVVGGGLGDIAIRYGYYRYETENN